MNDTIGKRKPMFDDVIKTNGQREQKKHFSISCHWKNEIRKTHDELLKQMRPRGYEYEVDNDSWF